MDDRKKAFENKFAHDEELLFKAKARCNRLIAEWAGEQMSANNEQIEAFASELSRLQLNNAPDSDIITIIFEKLSGAGVRAEQEDVAIELEKAMATAKDQIIGELTDE
jgi:hypothetical protein